MNRKKEKLLCFVLICILTAALLCGCSQSDDAGSDPVATTATVENPQVTETAAVTEVPVQTESLKDLFPNVPQQYLQVLEHYLTVDGPRGYALMDLDGNRTEELMITDGSQIYALYTIIRDGTLEKKLDETDGYASIQLCTDNRIFTIKNEAFNNSTFYCMLAMSEKVGNLPQDMCVISINGEEWYAGPYEKDAVPVTQAEAQRLLDAVQFQQISYVPFPEG